LTKWSNQMDKIGQHSSETEKLILSTAEKVFEHHGYNGTRMQQIADEAGISKASLHYYFRSKDNLFQRVFELAMDEYLPIISTWYDDSLDWEEKVERYTNQLVDFIRNGKMLFLIREINRNPDLINDRIKKAKSPNGIVAYFEKELQSGKIRQFDPRYLYLFLNSICCFPILNKALFKKTLRLTDKQYDDFLHAHAKNVADFFIHAIKNS
ncbi:MAG: TetR/AcrR family transcriptional regulator, partial [Chitinophagaceae bacterium]